MSAAMLPDIPAATPGVQPEDAARAGYYGLLAQLFYGAPDAALLNTLADAMRDAGGGDGSPFADAWRDLCKAAATTDAETAASEYDNVFVGVGKAQITLYASHYLRKASPERTLVKLRAELAALGLGRQTGAAEPEDHLAALCDVMRHLILRGGGRGFPVDTPDAALQQQSAFFLEYISPWYEELCILVAASGQTHFYKRVAAFARAFFDIEAEACELE